MDPRTIKVPTLSVTIPKTSANPIHPNANKSQSNLAHLISLAKEARRITQTSQSQIPALKPKGPKPVLQSRDASRSASTRNFKSPTQRKVVTSAKPPIKDRNTSAKTRAAIKQKESKDAIRARLLRSLSQESRSGKNAKTAKKGPPRARIPSPESPAIRIKPAIAKIQQRVEKRGRPTGKKNKSAKRGKSASKSNNKGIARTGKVQAKIARKQQAKADKEEMGEMGELPDLPDLPSEDEDLRDSIERMVKGTRSRVSEEKIIQRLQNQFYEITGEHVKELLNRLVQEGLLLCETKDFYSYIKKRDRQQKTQQRKQPKRQQKKDVEEEESDEDEDDEDEEEEAQIEIIQEEEKDQVEEKEVVHDPVDDVIETLFVKINEGVMEEEDIADKATQSKSKAEIEEKGAEAKDLKESKEGKEEEENPSQHDLIKRLLAKINKRRMEEDIGIGHKEEAQSKSKAENEEKGVEAKESKEEEEENPPHQDLITRLLAKINKRKMEEEDIGIGHKEETQSKSKGENGEKGTEEKDQKEEKKKEQKEPAPEVIESLFKIGERIVEEEDVGDKEAQSKPKAGNEEKGAEVKDPKGGIEEEQNSPHQDLIKRLLAKINKKRMEEEDTGDKETQSKSKGENEEKGAEAKDLKEEKEEVQKEEQNESAEEGIEILIVKQDEDFMEEEDIGIGDKETQRKPKAENEEKGAEVNDLKEEIQAGEESKKEDVQGENDKEDLLKADKEKGEDEPKQKNNENDQKNGEQVVPTQLIQSDRQQGDGMEEEQGKLEAKNDQIEDETKQDKDENDQKNDEQVFPTQLIESDKQEKLPELDANIEMEEEQAKLEPKDDQDNHENEQKNNEQVFPTQLIEPDTQDELPVLESKIEKDRQQGGKMEEEEGKDENDQKNDEQVFPTQLIESDKQEKQPELNVNIEMEEEQSKLEPKDDRDNDENEQKNDEQVFPTQLIEPDTQDELSVFKSNVDKDRQQGDEMEEEQGKLEAKDDQDKDETDQKNDKQFLPTQLIEPDTQDELPVCESNIEKDRQQGGEMEEEQVEDEADQKMYEQVNNTLLIESDQQDKLLELDINIEINILQVDIMEEKQSKLEVKNDEKEQEQDLDTDRCLNQGSGDNSVPGFSGQAGLTGLAERPEDPIQPTLLIESPLEDIANVPIVKEDVETVKQLMADEMEEERTVPDDPQMELERQKELDGEGDGNVFNNMIRDGEISSEGKENREAESEPIDTEDYEPAKVKKVRGEKDQLVPVGEQQGNNRSMDQIFG